MSTAISFKTTTPDSVPLHDVTSAVFNSTANACSTCSARCCYEYTVTVTGWDVWRIAELNIAPQQFLVYFPTREDNNSGFRLAAGEERYDLALDKTADDNQPNACVFLMTLPGGSGRCGIHASRPQVCRTYPAALNGEVVCLRDDAICPSGAWKLAHMDVVKWRNELTDFVMHRDLYEAVVAIWNQRVEVAGREHGIDEYFDYLLNTYALLAPALARLDDETDSEVLADWCKLRDQGAENPIIKPPGKRGALRRFINEINAGLDSLRSEPETVEPPSVAAS